MLYYFRRVKNVKNLWNCLREKKRKVKNCSKIKVLYLPNVNNYTLKKESLLKHKSSLFYILYLDPTRDFVQAKPGKIR